MESHIISVGGTPYQPCWGCGELAGGNEAHVSYGDFPFGIEHIECNKRIKLILNRSLRALYMIDEDCDAETRQAVMGALITAAANKLNNKCLNQFETDFEIRRAVESEGLQAAIGILRSHSLLDNISWKNRLKIHQTVMKGPEVIEEALTYDDMDLKASTVEFLKKIFKNNEKRETQRFMTLESMNNQLKAFSQDFQNRKNTTPFCILKDVIQPYCESSGGIGALQELLKDIERRGIWKVLFLAKEHKDSSFRSITHVIVKHIALMPSEIPLPIAIKAWEKLCTSQDNSKSSALTLECLEWRDHWVSIEEIKMRISVGEGSKRRPEYF